MLDAWLRLGERAHIDVPNEHRPLDVDDYDWRTYVETVVRPLAELIDAIRPGVVGLSGPPGSGKSTLARVIASTTQRDALVLSLDDFYLSREDRRRRGMTWRGPPGSHDLPLLFDVLSQIRARHVPISIPRFDPSTDDRSDPTTLTAPPELVLLDGWFLGYTGDGYGEILDHIDLLVFLDLDEDESRTRRFHREQTLRDAGGGFAEEDMQRFWDEVLGPGMKRWGREAQASADLVITIGPDQRTRSVTAHDEAILAVLEQR